MNGSPPRAHGSTTTRRPPSEGSRANRNRPPGPPGDAPSGTRARLTGDRGAWTRESLDRRATWAPSRTKQRERRARGYCPASRGHGSSCERASSPWNATGPAQEVPRQFQTALEGIGFRVRPSLTRNRLWQLARSLVYPTVNIHPRLTERLPPQTRARAACWLGHLNSQLPTSAPYLGDATAHCLTHEASVTESI